MSLGKVPWFRWSRAWSQPSLQVSMATLRAATTPTLRPTRCLERAEGPRTGWTWDLRHPKRRPSTFPSPRKKYLPKGRHTGQAGRVEQTSAEHSTVRHEQARESALGAWPKSAGHSTCSKPSTVSAVPQGETQEPREVQKPREGVQEINRLERPAKASDGVRMYNWKALLVQRPNAWIKWSGPPLQAATIAAPMRKLWLEKLPGMPAATIIWRIQLVSRARDKGQPSWSRKKGPPELPLRD